MRWSVRLTQVGLVTRVGALLALLVVGLGATRVAAQEHKSKPMSAADGALVHVFDKISPGIAGGNIPACRRLGDPYPEFNGIAVDPKNNVLVMTDTNLKSVLVYKRSDGESPRASAATPYRQQILGPATYLSFTTGVALDPVTKTIYTGENDIGDDLAAFPYGANGNYPAKVLATPHEVYGVALNRKLRQIAMAVEHDNEIAFFRLGALGAEPPLREIRGPHTELADPHGMDWDTVHNELALTNHGNWSQGAWDPDYEGGGYYQPPSVEVFDAAGKGDVKPLRVIQGSKTHLDWPSGISINLPRNEIAVANMSNDSVTIYSRTANGNVAPLRILSGPNTLIRVPMGVAFDPVHRELWVSDFGHVAMVFDDTASGNATPKRVIRNAPAGTEISGFGNPMAMAYDSKRDELIVPN